MLVADAFNHRVQVFDGTGNTEFGSFENGAGQLTYPRAFVVDQSGNIVLADMGNHRIQVFGQAGRALAAGGLFGSQNAEFNGPKGVTLDKAGNVLVQSPRTGLCNG